MVRVKPEERVACDGCGHAASTHSNEACEAIRCSCRITRKMLAKSAPRVPLPRVAPVAPNAAPEPAKRSRKRTVRELDAARPVVRAAKTEAA